MCKEILRVLTAVGGLGMIYFWWQSLHASHLAAQQRQAGVSYLEAFRGLRWDRVHTEEGLKWVRRRDRAMLLLFAISALVIGVDAIAGNLHSR